MREPLADKVIGLLGTAPELYYRLILIVAPSGSGKTAILQDVSTRIGSALLNLNLEVSHHLLDLSERQRTLQIPHVLEEIVGRYLSVVLVDNIEILFDVSLKQDPLRLLQLLSRHRTVVASWNGTIDDGYLTYATPEHTEYRRYPTKELMVVCPGVVS